MHHIALGFMVVGILWFLIVGILVDIIALIVIIMPLWVIRRVWGGGVHEARPKSYL